MEVLSILNEDGSLDAKYQNIISDDDMLAILKMMIFNRIFDQRMLTLQRQGRLGFYLTSTGEEAVTIGSAYCLNENDPIFMSYREFGALLWRKVPKDLIMNQLIGNNQDTSKGRQMPVHYCYKDFYIPSISSPLGTQLPQACGAAYAFKIRQSGQVALAYLGEGTASTGEFHAGVNFSGALGAPAVFILRNNGYAISTPESKQSASTCLAQRAEGYGIFGKRIDGNDLFAVIYAIREAVQRARNGEGPSLIECLTYRMGAHSSSDEPSKYRSAEEEHQWEKVDAMKRLQRHAQWRGLWNQELHESEEQGVHREIDELIQRNEKWPPPRTESLFEDVYASIPEHIKTQKEEYLSFLHRQDSKIQEEGHG